MRFYRNLGGITFESQTPSLQIFQAHPKTTIFQPKLSQAQHTLEQISTLHSQALQCQLHCYSEPGKGSSLILLNSKRPDLKNLDTQTICSLIMEAANSIKRISQFMSDLAGQCSIHQFRIVGEKIIFVYIPLTKIEDSFELQARKIKQLLALSRKLQNEKDISQKLLTKKLMKCNSVDQIIEQVSYFINVYCVGKSTIHEYPQRKTLILNQKHHQKSKSHRKGSLFKLDIPKEKKYQHSSFHSPHSKTFLSEQRQASVATHISSLQEKSILCDSSVYKRMSASHHKKESLLKHKKSNLSVSRVSEENLKQKINKKTQQKPRVSICTPIGLLDDSKLLEKLRIKKIEKQKAKEKQKERAQQTKNRQPSPEPEIKPFENEIKDVLQYKIAEAQSIERDKDNIDQLHSVNKYSVQNTRQIKNLSSKVSNNSMSIQLLELKQQEFTSKQPVRENKQSKIQQYFPSISEERFSEKVIQIPLKSNKKIESSFKKLKSQDPKVEEKQEVLQKAIFTNVPTQPLKKKQTKNLTKKPLQKKVFDYGDVEDQIEVIQIGNKPTLSSSKQEPVVSASKMQKENNSQIVQQFVQTQKKPWNINGALSSFASTQKTSLNNALKQQIFTKFDKLNQMGSAVANTTNYLAKYNKVFWQLPLYFIYRGFYFRRIKLAKQVQELPEQVKEEFSDLLSGNDKIEEIVLKLIKKVKIKLKKASKTLFQNLNPYLCLQEQINCDEIMKGYLKEYIQTLFKTASEDENLMHHFLEIVDAYLIYCGQQIDQTKRNQATKSDSTRRQYITQQAIKLNKYFKCQI